MSRTRRALSCPDLSLEPYLQDVTIRRELAAPAHMLPGVQRRGLSLGNKLHHGGKP